MSCCTVSIMQYKTAGQKDAVRWGIGSQRTLEGLTESGLDL